ncbi:helix-turn-helix transcriptional regulator [Pedobacter nyackensis]|uniref:helix-turn-helix domain-containing protein n=1 Tax=Pedobacter nyackensis TaxID=475255 RepID=UPI00292F19B6|nr:helix-turn-helix transcriptional regulator [Pedobacter nyackensis]
MDDKESIKQLFGARLKAIREEKKLSLKKTDAQSELDSSNIFKYESGQRDPQLTTIIKLAQALKIHPKELFDIDFGIDFSKDLK